MSNRGHRDPRKTGSDAERKGRDRIADQGEIRQQEIIQTIRQRRPEGLLRRLIHALKSIFAR